MDSEIKRQFDVGDFVILRSPKVDYWQDHRHQAHFAVGETKNQPPIQRGQRLEVQEVVLRWFEAGGGQGLVCVEEIGLPYTVDYITIVLILGFRVYSSAPSLAETLDATVLADPMPSWYFGKRQSFYGKVAFRFGMLFEVQKWPVVRMGKFRADDFMLAPDSSELSKERAKPIMIIRDQLD